MSTIDLDAIKRDILRACGMGVRKPVLSIEQAESLLREVERLRGEWEWIPVTERVPDDDRDVLTLNDQGTDSEGKPQPPFCEVNRRYPELGTWAWSGSLVTHWRELPAPPLARVPPAGRAGGGQVTYQHPDGETRSYNPWDDADTWFWFIMCGNAAYLGYVVPDAADPYAVRLAVTMGATVEGEYEVVAPP